MTTLKLDKLKDTLDQIIKQELYPRNMGYPMLDDIRDALTELGKLRKENTLLKEKIR